MDAQKQMRQLLQAQVTQMDIQHQQQQQQHFRGERTGSPQDVAVTLGGSHAAAMLVASSDEATAGITSAEQRRRLAVAKYKLKRKGRNFDKVCVLFSECILHVGSPPLHQKAVSVCPDTDSLFLCLIVR